MSTVQHLDGNEIRDRLRQALEPALGDSLRRLPDDADLAEELGGWFDSLAALEAVSTVEAEFGIAVDLVNDDVRHWFASVTRMTEFVAERLEDGALAGAVR